MATMAWGSILKKENVKVSQTPGTEMNEARMAEPIDKPALAEDTKMSIVADALIREYFKRHGNDKALAAFDVERPKCAASITSSSALLNQFGLNAAYKELKSKYDVSSILEVLLSENDSTTTMTEPKMTAKKIKASLSINTTPEVMLGKPGSTPRPQMVQDEGVVVLGKPGSTPRPRVVCAEADIVLGNPGSTPKPRKEELDFLDIEAELEPTSPIRNVQVKCSKHPNLKSILKKGPKKMKLKLTFGQAKPMYFCRNTPTDYLYDTPEQACEKYLELFNEPVVCNIEVHERYVELSSSNVGKYTIGSMVQNLGPTGSVSGKVHQKKGSRECGNGGPGTVIIDTQPENAVDAQPSSSPIASSPRNFEDELSELLEVTEEATKAKTSSRSVSFFDTEEDRLMAELLGIE